MKLLNFSAVGVLPSLLDKSKTQTIRPAWEWNEGYYKNKDNILDSRRTCGEGCCNDFMEKKPARFKVVDNVQLMWNQRSKYRFFWINDGSPVLSCDDPFVLGDFY